MKKLLFGIVMFSVLFITPVLLFTSSVYALHILFGLNIVSTYVVGGSIAVMSMFAGITILEKVMGI